MLSAILKRATYANVAATIALVFAMTGGAYAASRVVIKSLNQISPSVQKKLKGKTGSTGPAGKAGSAGSVGPAGPTGPAGAVGPAGAAGTAGVAGTAGEKGVTGEKGPEGSPWTVGGVLPKDKSLSGNWVASVTSGASATPVGKFAPTSISFDLPLETAPTVHIIRETTPEASDPAGCSGTVEAPVAEPGNLCIFTSKEVNVTPEEGSEEPGYKEFSPEEKNKTLSAGKRGIVFGPIAAVPAEPVFAMGVWVVTAAS